MSRASPEPQGTFPKFDDADVLIIISPSRQFHLHARILRRASTLFSNLLARGGAPLSKRAIKSGVTIRYRLLLVEHQDRFRMKRVDLDTEGRTVDGSSIGYENVNGLLPAPVYRYYEMLLQTFYSHELRLDDTSLASVLRDAIGLIEVAEYIGSVPMVAKIIDNALITEGPTLHRSISTDPLAWIDLAYRLSSRFIFKESLIHLVGRYNELAAQPPDEDHAERYPFSRTLLDQMRPETRSVVDDKAKALKTMCQQAEQLMSTYYPANLHRSSVTGRADRDNIGRNSYANDIMSWMALGLFRHYLGQMVAEDGTHRSTTDSRKFYDEIGRGGQAYLDKKMVAGFHSVFPMSAKGQAVLENHLNALKEAAKSFVEPLLVNKSQMDIVKFPVQWLTCTEVKAGEYPWEVKDSKKRAASEAFDASDDESDEELEQRGRARGRAGEMEV